MPDTITLHDYQQRGVALGMEILADPFAPPPHRRMLAAPTGAGKSYIVIELQRQATIVTDAPVAIVSPRPDILKGIARKMGLVFDDLSQAKQQDVLEAAHLWTPIRLLNAMADDKVEPYDCIIGDEVHHAIAATWSDLFNSASKLVGVTATPYRGGPAGTQKLHEEWGKPIWLLTLAEGIEQNYISRPHFRVKPIIDDDLLGVSAGEFKAKDTESLVLNYLDELLTDVIEQRVASYDEDTDSLPCGAIVMPSVELACQAAERLKARGIAVELMVGETKHRDRPALFEKCTAGNCLLSTVGVLAEGVDLPIEQLFVCKPMKSPVAAMQLWGRATRPGLSPVIHEYSRNLERHAHLWEGFMPLSQVSELQQAFGGPSKRGGSRALEIEAVARFKCLPVPLAGDLWGEGYMLYRGSQAEGHYREFAVLTVPWSTEPIVASRPHSRGKWVLDTIPVEMEGYSTLNKTSPMTEKQEDWWKGKAKSIGLDEAANVDKRTFSFLPALLQSFQHVRLPKGLTS